MADKLRNVKDWVPVSLIVLRLCICLSEIPVRMSTLFNVRISLQTGPDNASTDIEGVEAVSVFYFIVSR